MTEADNPYESLDIVSDTPMPTHANTTKPRFPELLVVVGIIAVLMALILPAIQYAKSPRPMPLCKNNLKNIAFALHSYAAKNNGTLPPAYTIDSEGMPLHSWRTLILPYIDRQDLYEKVDLSKPWNDPANAEVFKAYINVYHCPSGETVENYTTYLAIVAPNGCFRPTEPRELAETTAIAAETLMVIDMAASQAVPWMSPLDANEQMVLDIGVKTQPAHPGGTNVAFVDGSVGFLDANTSAAERRALISIAENGETGSTDSR